MKIFSWEPTAFSKWLSIKSENRLGDVKLILSIWFFSRYEVVLTKYREFTGLNYRWVFENAILHDFNVQKFHIGISASTYSPLKIDECVQSVRSRREIDSFMYKSHSMHRSERIIQYASYSSNRTERIVQYESYGRIVQFGSYGTHCTVWIAQYES